MRSLQRKKRYDQSKNLKFLSIKIPKIAAKNSWDIEVTDHIQDMKQNIQLMNQVYKNFYALYSGSYSSTNFWQDYIVLELYIEKESIKLLLAVPWHFVDNVEKMISSFYPGAVVEPMEQPVFLEAWKYIAWWEIVLKKSSEYPLKTYESFEADPMDSLLASYSKVDSDEKLSLQIMISPVAASVHKSMRKKIEKIKEWKPSGIWHTIKSIWRNIVKWAKWDKKEDKNHEFSSQQQQSLDQKAEDELFDVKIRMLATSPHPERPEKITEDLARSLYQYNYVGLNSFVFKKAKDLTHFVKAYVLRSFFSSMDVRNTFIHHSDKQILNIKELSSLIHFPNSKFNRNPRLRRQNFKIVPAPDNIPTEGILLGYNTYGWVKKEIRVSPVDRFRHFYIIWQTGTGKSTALLTMAQQDVPLGNGFCLIDPHWDLCEHILKYIPKERIEDLIYFDFANTDYPIGFNMFEAETEDERDIVTNDITEMFVSMYGHEIFGPRIQDYFRNASFLLMEQPDGGTLPEIMRLFTDEAYLDSKLRHLQNPVIRSRWTKTYKSMGDREKAEIIPFLQAKFWPFTTWVYVRNVIGQPKSWFNFFDAMNQKKIILCNLSKWLTWEINSQLIWRMFASQIKLSALKRASIVEDQRVPFFLYVDEFQNYVSQSFESVLSEARKYRLGLCIAHQYIEQLKNSWLWGSIDLSKPIFGNVGNQLYYKVGPEDAEFLEKNVSPEFNKNDMVSIDARKWVLTLSVWWQPTRPFSINMHNPYAEPVINSPEKVAIIKQISALKWWTKRELVDKEVFYRVGV
jgi:TraM recognition site of TraD and TraG